jgi:hypothetical protein
MPLDPNQRRAVIEWCDLYLRDCPVCQCRDYVFECVVAMPEVGPAEPPEIRGIPVVPIVCRSCGYTILVSATAMRLAPGMQPTARILRGPGAGDSGHLLRRRKTPRQRLVNCRAVIEVAVAELGRQFLGLGCPRCQAGQAGRRPDPLTRLAEVLRELSDPTSPVTIEFVL